VSGEAAPAAPGEPPAPAGTPLPWKVGAGRPVPLGATVTTEGIGFALVAAAAARVWLVVWDGDERRHDLELEPGRHRTGDVWHVGLGGARAPLAYAWRVDAGGETRVGPGDGRLLLDPYCRAVIGAERWGEPPTLRRCLALPPLELLAETTRPRIEPSERVIYELCVRGFTAHPSAGAAEPGTYRALIAKLPHLVALGVTTVELMPLAEWDELEPRLPDPTTGERQRNLWGYSPIAFCAPKAGLAASAAETPGGQVAELRELVEACHAAGLEVIVDVVFNHTAERDGLPGDPVFSWAGIDRRLYYATDEAGRFLDATGCGNTLAAARPRVADLLTDALRVWATEIGVDGFRFDLAAALTRDVDLAPLADPPLLRQIESEPALAGRLLVAEAWDAGGLYRVGDFARRGRWGEWNDRFRDDVRRFVRGEPGMAAALATRLAGSEDRFGDAPQGPLASINYVTCHDGPTLADLVAYERKHNLRNGEGNRDGPGARFAWNCGVEGDTDDPVVLALRERQIRNLLTLLFLAQGVPMLLAGDEMGRTQQGNDNAWCRDDEIGWVDWADAARNAGLLRFTRELIAFRRAHPVLRRGTFLTGRGTQERPRPDVEWHGTRLHRPDWGKAARALAMHLAGEHAPAPDCDVYLAANAGRGASTFELPEPPVGERWLRVVATWVEAPRDLLEPGQEEMVPGPTVVVPAHSCVVLRSGVPQAEPG
jgi:isoamylase